MKTMKTHLLSIKDKILLSTFMISHLHFLFRGDKTRVDWWLFTDMTRRIDYAVMYYGIAINFLILTYCLHYPKGVSRKVSRFILFVSLADILHLITFSKINFGIAKIFICMIIYFLYEKCRELKRF